MSPYNRFGAGLRQFFWMRYCGHSWRFAWRAAMTYWRAAA